METETIATSGVTEPPEEPLPLQTQSRLQLQPRGEVNPAVVWVACSVGLLAAFSLLAWATGNWHSTRATNGFDRSFGLITSLLLGVPATVTFSVVVPRLFTKCMCELQRSGAIAWRSEGPDAHTGDQVKPVIEGMRERMFRRNVISSSFAASAAFLCIAIPQHLKQHDWTVKNRAALVFTELVWFFAFATVVLLAIRLFIGIQALNKLFRPPFVVQVQPLHPDGAGGLATLSSLSLKFGYLFFAFGLQLTANQFTTGYSIDGKFSPAWNIDILVSFAVYLFLAPVFFFAPLSVAHSWMKSAKANQQRSISDEFQRQFDVRNPNLGSAQIEHINKLKELYDVVNTFPVWPFESEKLLRFSAAVIAPICVGLAVELLKHLLKL